MKGLLKKLILCILFLTGNISHVALSQSIPTENEEQIQLAIQLRRSIPFELRKLESILPQINVLIKKGEKVQASIMIEDALKQISKIEANQELLMQIDDTADDESLMVEQVLEIKHYLANKANSLRYANTIYIDCNAELFNTNYPTLKAEIQGELSKLGCTFVNNAAQSDWAVYVTAQAREHNKADFGSMSTYFVYVDANIAVEKTATGQRIYENEISEKGGHTQSFEKAARDAYKVISPKISQIIKQQIQH